MANLVIFVYILSLVFHVVICIESQKNEPLCSKFSFMEQLLEKMVRMELNVEKMRDEMMKVQDAVKEELRALQTERETFKTMFSALNDEFKTVKASVETEKENMKTEFSVLKDKNKKAMKSQSDEIGKNFNQQASQIVRMSEDLRVLENTTVRKLTDLAVTPVVAFKARIPADLTLTTNQIMIFTKTILNEGQGYDIKTGKFTAPISGLYLLTAQLCTYYQKYIFYDIVVDDVSQIRGTFYDGTSAQPCYSVDVVVKMQVGMKAWIQSGTGTSDNGLVEQESYRWSMFSGFLINKLPL